MSALPILQVRHLRRYFGGVQALCGVDLDVPRRVVMGLIGPNGSGKTTLFQVVSGMDRRGTGIVVFDGEPILGLRPSRIYRRGLGRTFQLSRLFSRLTVLENLIVAGPRHEKKRVAKRARELLEKIRLQDYADSLASDLSYGQQRLVEFTRVLMNNPSLVLLDEPAAGVNPVLRETLWELVRQLNRLGTTFLIIEHNMKVIADLCAEVYVLNEGEIIAHGDFNTVREDERVIEAYFGVRKAEQAHA